MKSERDFRRRDYRLLLVSRLLRAFLAIQAAYFGLPFFLGGGVKVLYDISLHTGFRNRLGEHDVRRSARRH